MRRFKSLYYNVIYGIQNIFIWLPVIWSDRDWDEGYLYIILHKKISRMEKLFKTDRPMMSEGNDEIIQELATVRKALERLIDGEHYYLEACDFYNVLPYDFEDEKYKEHIVLTQERAEMSEMKDIETVFSTEVSSKIKGWWD